MSIICGSIDTASPIWVSELAMCLCVCPCLVILFTWGMQSVASAMCRCAHKKPSPNVNEASGIAG